MSTCLGKMIIEDEHEISPQMRRMKLSSEVSNDFEIRRSDYIEADLQKEMKFVFPYLNEEKIKEILVKSENNAESARKMVHDMNKAEAEKSREFINLHKENRKRRFDDINKFSLQRNEAPHTNLSNNISGSNNSTGITLNPFQINSNTTSSPSQNLIFNRRKILLSNMVTSYCSDEEVEKMINDLTAMNRDQAKEYLKKTISLLIKEKTNKYINQPSGGAPNRETLIQDQQMVNQRNEDKKNIEEMKAKIETLLVDNADLKKVVVVIYKRENNAKKENQELLAQINKLQRELSLKTGELNSIKDELNLVKQENIKLSDQMRTIMAYVEENYNGCYDYQGPDQIC